MSIFFVSADDVADALVEATEYLSKVRVFVYPGGLVPFPPAFWLMELTTAYELRELTLKWTRAYTGRPLQDAAMCTFHIANFTGGVPDATWTAGDYATCEALFDTYWGAIKEWFNASHTLSEYTWRADGPAFKPYGAALQPTLRATPKAVVGTGTGTECPPQVAISVTEVVPATFVAHNVEGVGDQTRNRWGRFYLPNPSVNAIDAGRIHTDCCEDVAIATKALYDGLAAADFGVVVYSPTTGHAWTVTQVHVDDIADVIRRRRFDGALSRHSKDIVQVD